MTKLKFLFGNHNHQPVGNFDSVFEEAVERSYKPFLEILSEYPKVRMSLHFSGCLLDWLEANQPDLLDSVAELAGRGQVEILSSGYYEPVLSAIPAWDRQTQLAQMNDYIGKRFGRKPRGAWMTERVWESHIVDSLVDAGLDYVVIDDYHFKCAGMSEDGIQGYYNTENDGSALAVFPIKEKLRYLIPFSDPGKTIGELRRMHEAGHELAVMIDDGEKFGLWPGTHKVSYRENWVRRFFDLLLAEESWLELATPADVLDSMRPTGMVYLPSASYFEMSEWTLPGGQAGEFADIVHSLQDNGQIERFRPFLRGGIWRNFLMKYPESNNMHKRMLDISKRLHAQGKRKEKRLEEARGHLLTAQCNCAYWHGVFGGLNLPHLRDAVYRELIAADALLADIEGLGPVESWDINLDGSDEALLRSESLAALVTPAYGGALLELDVIDRRLNLINTLASRQEGYHAGIIEHAGEAGDDGDAASIHDMPKKVDESLRDELRYDWHNRYSFLDHFLPLGSTLEAQRNREFRDLGDFVNQPWQLDMESGGARLTRHGKLYTDQGEVPVTVSKRYSLEGDTLRVDYTITNTGSAAFPCLFAPELNFSMLGGNDPEISYASGSWHKQKMVSAGERRGTDDFSIIDKRKGITISLNTSEVADFWYFPSRTVSQSESGFELNYQSSVIVPVIRLENSPEEETVITINMQVRTS